MTQLGAVNLRLYAYSVVSSACIYLASWICDRKFYIFYRRSCHHSPIRYYWGKRGNASCSLGNTSLHRIHTRQPSWGPTCTQNKSISFVSARSMVCHFSSPARISPRQGQKHEVCQIRWLSWLSSFWSASPWQVAYAHSQFSTTSHSTGSTTA